MTDLNKAGLEAAQDLIANGAGARTDAVELAIREYLKVAHAEDSMEGLVGPDRRKMPKDRDSLTHKFEVGGFEGYITAGMYEDGSLGELFLADIGKEGSTFSGVVQAFAVVFSIALQYGAPLDMLTRKLAHMRFDPEGETGNPEIPHAHSIIDYIARWLALRFGDEDLHEELRLVALEMMR